MTTSKRDQVLLDNKYLIYNRDNIYIFKFVRRGAFITVNERKAVINRIWFIPNSLTNEWILDHEYKTKTITAKNHNELLNLINEELEVLQFGRNRKNR